MSALCLSVWVHQLVTGGAGAAIFGHHQPGSCNLCAHCTAATVTPSEVTIPSFYWTFGSFQFDAIWFCGRLMFMKTRSLCSEAVIPELILNWLPVHPPHDHTSSLVSEKQPKARMSPEPQLTGLAKTFNSVTFTGRANVAKATYASMRACKVSSQY